LDLDHAEEIASASDDDALTKCQQIAALADDLCPEAVQQLVAYLGDDHPFVRWEAGIALGDVAARLQKSGLGGLSRWTDRSSTTSLSALLARMQESLLADAPDRRSATADALGLWHHKAVTPLLLQALSDEEPSVRVSAATALGKIKGDESVQPLVAALDDPSLWVRRAAADALGAIADPRAAPVLQQALADPQILVCASAVSALGHTNSSRARAALIESTRSDEPAIRWYAARGLASIGTVSALPALRELLHDETILFGESIAEMADSAIVAIEKRQEGFLNGLVKMFHELRYRLQKNP